MKKLKRACYCAVAIAACILLPLRKGFSQSQTSQATAAAVPAQRDGSHDFDWDMGAWKTHQRRLLHPLTGSTTWVEYSGTDVVRKIWDGANQGFIEADGPA